MLMAKIAVPLASDFEDAEYAVPRDRLCAAGHSITAVKGRTLTSSPSVRKDLENAGATWRDQEVVEDGNLITSRKPDDLAGTGGMAVAVLRMPAVPRVASSPANRADIRVAARRGRVIVARRSPTRVRRSNILSPET